MSHLESLLQINCVRYFRYAYPRCLCFSVPNGGYRTKTNGRILKAEGATAGVADLIIVADGKIAFVELKTETGRQQPSQKEFQQNVERLGFQYLICRSFDDFQEKVDEFIGSKNAPKTTKNTQKIEKTAIKRL